MKRRSRILLVVLSVVVYFETFLVISSPEVRVGADLVWKKATGEYSWINWPSTLSMAIPWYVRPAIFKARQHPGAYMTTPVRLVHEEEGTRLAEWETELGNFWASGEEPDLLAHLVDEQMRKRVYDQEYAHVRKGDVVFDGGAHIGTFARFALDKGASKVVGFEPDPRNVECLNKTFAQEIADGRFVLVEAALWNEPGQLIFHLSGENSARSSAVRGEGKELNVRAVSIDETVEELNLERVDFIKMDIEGAERKAIAGAQNTIQQFQPRMAICIYHLPDDPIVITRSVLEIHPEYEATSNREVAYFY